jgi:spore coat protein U-like protein
VTPCAARRKSCAATGSAINFGNVNPIVGNAVAATGNGNAQVISVYGQVPAQTSPAPGTYSDTITATIVF